MKVEQQCENGANSSQMLINQLREITGIQDLQILQKALSASQGDISQAVGLLTGETPAENLTQEQLLDAEGKKENWHDQAEVVAMTPGVDRDDLQTAIELSLQESQKAKAEEIELNRALEVSAAESSVKVKRRKCEGSGDGSSPADWNRQDDWPVGIRNVGNTCWFSAVIQSLFHLPVFRRLVLNYCLSERVLEKCKSHADKRNLAFMQELRCLFALMVGSTRRFVDPSAAVELLKDAFRTSEAQQDVSEFTHKLLDWLEDAFQLAANGNNPEDKQENPMVQLFYGNFVAERYHEGQIQSTIEQFGQYPLQVNGFNNLDECLEGAMVEGEIESLHSDQTISSGSERWFQKLPPVLTFELSRFEFNQSLGRPEKIHKKLEFPQIIYMDRYLHWNNKQIHDRRGEVKRLKEQLTSLQQKLECYKNYGSGPAKYPLADMLQYMLEFATTKPTSVSPAEDGRISLSPTPLGVPTQTEHFSEDTSHSESGGDPSPSDGSGCQVPAGQRTPIYKPFTQCKPPMETPSHPAPHSVSEEELQFVKGCLQRWRTEVENNTNELKASIDRISQSLEGIYLDNSLCQVPYRLHAVLVHEGQASAGHYWAYIYDHSAERWLKCNDVVVSESSWEELERDSFGGITNASAYCLMYIDDRLPHLVAEHTDDETGQVLRGMDSLPPVLRQYVREDNRWFQQELREWEEQLRQAQQEEPLVPMERSAPIIERDAAERGLESTSEEPAKEPARVPQQEPEPVTSWSSLEATPSVCADGGHFENDQLGSVPTYHNTADEEKSAQQSQTSADLVGGEDHIKDEAKVEDKVEVKDEVEVKVEVKVKDEVEVKDKVEVKEEIEIKDEVEVKDEVEGEAIAEVSPDEAAEDEGVNGTAGPAGEQEARLEAGATASPETQTADEPREPESELSEVEIPNVGKILVRSDADGYNEEMMLTPTMQGIILAIAKARQAFDKDGPEAGLIKAFHEEYSRLYELSQEETTPQQDPRLQHVLVYFFQNRAPNRVIERTLLEQFTDRNLSFDERSISIKREARKKLRLIMPEDMDMEEYTEWHDEYSLFRTVFVYLLTGLEQYQNGKVREALIYLAHAYQDNQRLLRRGERRGVERSLIARYRRKCLMELNEIAATLFKSGEEEGVAKGVALMNDSVIPCMHLMSRDSVSQEDLDAMETIRSHWCSYLGQEMDDVLQEKLGEFLPRVLDGLGEAVVLKEPPQVRSSMPHDLCSRLAAVMESIHSSSVVIVK